MWYSLCYSIACLVTRSTILPFAVLVYLLLVLVCLLLVLVCQLIVLIVLPVGLFITDRFEDLYFTVELLQKQFLV